MTFKLSTCHFCFYNNSFVARATSKSSLTSMLASHDGSAYAYIKFLAMDSLCKWENCNYSHQIYFLYFLRALIIKSKTEPESTPAFVSSVAGELITPENQDE